MITPYTNTETIHTLKHNKDNKKLRKNTYNPKRRIHTGDEPHMAVWKKIYINKTQSKIQNTQCTYKNNSSSKA